MKFVELKNDQKKTTHTAVVVRELHEGKHADLFVFYPEFHNTRFQYNVPYKAHAFKNEKGEYPFPYVDTGVEDNQTESEV
jgi:hypothetical protein